MWNAIVFKARPVVCSIAIAVAVVPAAAWTQGAPAESRAAQSERAALATPTPVAYDARTRQVLIGVRDEVRRMEESANGQLLDRGRVHTGATGSILRVRLDARRERLWILEVGAVNVIDLATNRRIARITLPNWIFSGQGDNCRPDLQIDEHGAALVSDNMQPK